MSKLQGDMEDIKKDSNWNSKDEIYIILSENYTGWIKSRLDIAEQN